MFLIGEYILLEDHKKFLEDHQLKITKHSYFNTIRNKENEIVLSILPNCKIFAINCQQKSDITLIKGITTNLNNVVQFLLKNEKYSEFFSLFETSSDINKNNIINTHITNELKNKPIIHSFLKKHNFIF